MDVSWTIGELAERAAAALAADGSTQVSGRVRDLPNRRLIRWYTTIGLVDPPLGRRGRTAVYGRRHLLQLVAVKRRQAAGHSIAEIQTELAGATDETLERIAALPVPAASPPGSRARAPGTPPAPGSIAPGGAPRRHVPGAASAAAPATGIEAAETSAAAADVTESEEPAADRAPADGTAPAGAGDAAREPFWRARPDISYTETAVADDYGDAGPRATLVQGVRLTPGLTLLLDAPALNGDDLAAIEAAARPLLDELRRRGLLTPATDRAFPPADPSRRFS